MTKKFKLRKDHPYAKAGTLIEEVEPTEYACRCFKIIESNIVGYFPASVLDEWLEPVETRWRPNMGEYLYFVDHCLSYERTRLSHARGLDIDDPNAFSTAEQAQEAAKRIRALLEAYHEEIAA